MKEPVGGHCSVPQRGLTPHANAPWYHNQPHIVNTCSHAERAENARHCCSCSSVQVTPGYRGRRFSQFHPVEERHMCLLRILCCSEQQCNLMAGTVQTEMTSVKAETTLMTY